MLHTNSNKQKSEKGVLIPLMKTRLTLRLVDGIVHIHDSFSGREWDTSIQYARMLLACAVQSSEDTRIVDIQESFFEHSDLRVFEGWFPVDQIIFQQNVLHYNVYADQKARASSRFRPDLFLSVEHALEIPTMEQVSPKAGDFITSWNEEEGGHNVMIFSPSTPKPSVGKIDVKLKSTAVAAVVMLALFCLSLQHSGANQHLQASGPRELSIHGKS